MSQTQGDPIVRVARHAEDYFDEVAVYRLSDLARPHWSQVSGGRGSLSARVHLYAYVLCDGAVSGGVGHSGEHASLYNPEGGCPHKIKVCILDSYCQPDSGEAVFEGENANDPSVLAELIHKAGPRPTPRPVCPFGHSVFKWTDACSSCGQRWDEIPEWARVERDEGDEV